MRELPKAGEIYRHFKGMRYLIAGYVKNATSGADFSSMVLYLPEDEADKIHRQFYCRTVTEFMSPVDKVKYPDATQNYRFERVGR